MSNASNAQDPAHRARLFPRLGRDEIRWDPPRPVHIRTRVIDPETGREILEADKPGELQITGPTVFDGISARPDHGAIVHRRRLVPDRRPLRTRGRRLELRFYRFVGRLKQTDRAGRHEDRTGRARCRAFADARRARGRRRGLPRRNHGRTHLCDRGAATRRAPDPRIGLRVLPARGRGDLQAPRAAADRRATAAQQRRQGGARRSRPYRGRSPAGRG